MKYNSADVKDLMLEALQHVTDRRNTHVILHTFQAIEHDPVLRTRHQALVAERGVLRVNTLGGAVVAQEVGGRGVRQVDTKDCTLIGSYSELEFPT